MITLVPEGGLGNRLKAICSTISYCKQKQQALRIIWFNSWGLRCDYDKLFTLAPGVDFIEIHNAKPLDWLMRDNPRKKNFWIPALFEHVLFNKCIYWYKNSFKPANIYPPYSDELEKYARVFIVQCGAYWQFAEGSEQYIQPTPLVRQLVAEKKKKFAPNTIGIHIRRTDNVHNIRYSPTKLFMARMIEEVNKDHDVKFYLASDSLNEKAFLIECFGDRIITSLHGMTRETEDGIVEAFAEMLVLGSCRKIYAGLSTFAEMAAFFGKTECVILETEKPSLI
jgi:hypothetical protein